MCENGEYVVLRGRYTESFVVVNGCYVLISSGVDIANGGDGGRRQLGYSCKFVKRCLGEPSSFYVTFGICSVGTLALSSRLEGRKRGSLFCRWLGARWRWRWRLIEAFVIVVKKRRQQETTR